MLCETIYIHSKAYKCLKAVYLLGILKALFRCLLPCMFTIQHIENTELKYSSISVSRERFTLDL